MKKKCNLFFLLLLAVGMRAQQGNQYTQFLLNEYGLNPAVAGSENGLRFMVGRRSQWVGFEFSPETNFASFCKDLGKKGYKYYWHGIGAYVESDKFGVFNNQQITGSYAIHFKVSYSYYLSFALAAGAKNVALSNLVFNSSDPAIMQRGPSVWIPTIIPGAYLYSKSVTIGAGIRDLYQNKLKQGNSEIGTKTRLLPTAYITLSKKYRSRAYDYTFIPAVLVQSSFSGIPSVTLNCMAVYMGRVGFGFSYRSMDAMCAILQVRVLKNVIIGLSYDYTVSRLRAAHANSLEGMMGFTPIQTSDEEYNQFRMSKCPAFDL